ncbi:DUF805 domain-containing protein [uncultured Draconibacterium sp.]|uniref:DUF805 domain-containing protein n=1 Tax=uncultured Draconibacterium sp. TaxID=1573823 RepID=UPI0025F68633|nr:DUF805 domain-containing protein [uncultured Draconibacterium sp.]
MNWYLKVLKQYADFNGRARRKEYWMFVLFNMIFGMIAGAADAALGTWGALSGLYGLAMLIPGIAVGVRRLHDTGKSGWMLLVAFIPVIGFIWLLILLVSDSAPGNNVYGENPKYQ